MTRLHRTLVVAALAVGLSVTSAEPAFSSPKAPATAVTGYTVRAGDYLMGIAMKLNVKVESLLAANKLVLTSLILPGQVLAIPANAKTTTVSPALIYVVVKNDYLTGISAKLNVSIRSLLTTNHLLLNSLIWPGQRLVVPAGGTLPPAKVAARVTSSAPPYVVVKGDSLSAIANKLGVTLQSLLALNQLSVSSVIYPDMHLLVPAGGTVPVAKAPGAGSATVPAKVGVVLAFVRAQLGKPYVAFGAGPDSFDCSGLTLAGYRQIGITLPHYSGAQIAFGTPVDWTREAIRPGDLVFLETSVGSGVIGHVGIATGATTWMHAPRTGDVVRVGNIPFSRVMGVRRLVNG